MNSKLILSLTLIYTTLLTGCLAPNNNETKDPATASSVSAIEVTAQNKLDQCTPGKEGAMVFEEASGSFFTCRSNVWVALNLRGEKGEKGEPGKDGTLPLAPVSPCLSIQNSSLHYGDRIDGSDYSFNAIRSLPNQKYCLDNGGNMWMDFEPSLKLMTSVPVSQMTFEENLCKSAFALPTIKDYYGSMGGSYFLQIRNANMGAKLKRAIICDPDMYGANLTFPRDY